jgi:TRAP-type uncharacterized transport system substrate-binding protein
MKMKALFGLALAVFLTIVPAAFGQSTIRIADDSSSGTYKKMLTELVNVCSTEGLDVQEATGVTGGAPGNLDALVNNRADAAFLHSDVFFANAQADPSYAKLKTLIALYPEPIHVLTLRVSKTKKTGTFSFGTVEINSLQDTAGYNVGAAGGGVFTARILQGQGQGGFNVIDEGTGANVISALDNGQIAAAIFVGAAPLPNLEKLNKANYKLIPIGENIANRVTGVYRPATINYPGMTNGPLHTLAPVATLLTRQFTTPSKVAAQVALRSCFEQKLDELKDTASPNWQNIESATDQGTLNNYLALPMTTMPTRKR